MGSKIPEQVFGFRELYRPQNEEPELDIVAVHGLNGHAINTWTAESPMKGGEPICWLNHPDFLPKFISRARVLTWGYNANVSSMKGPTSSDRILQHAQSLVQQLQGDRTLKGATERPIIFLCHSLGGIVVKRALAYSESRTGPKNSHLHSIFTCTYGIIFFGTPHHGSSKAQLLSSLQKVTRLTIPKRILRTESNLVKALEAESETLQNITDQFVALMSNFHLMFLWEQERTPIPGLGASYIVDESSAAPGLPDVERCGIAADHRGMCRFVSSSDQGFLTVIDALQRYSRAAPEEIKTRCARELWFLKAKHNGEAMELVRALGGPPMGTNALLPFPVKQNASEGPAFQLGRAMF
ncbi:uncharacterized protein PV07_10073 [Cladophialophora immunda]|uniref:DUF676 domain-containing protein n=1 Tax=Cladophialophora immunda TaxID=569365 RepID=A0A0D2CL99_9EURO|nr:uncharacterized protein PV07_10073 [Cladophialophora immunda]KIW24354.1 hypothetical protein PV07_10073 [Cladophialophora immunda]